MVFADIILINAGDEAAARRNIIAGDAVSKMTVKMCVDPSVYLMSITEPVRCQLALPVIGKRKLILKDKSVKEFDIVGPITVKFENRSASCNALVLADNDVSILGMIPFGELDVIIHPQRQELIVNPEHPYGAVLSMR